MITEFLIAVAISTAAPVQEPVLQSNQETVQAIMDYSVNPVLMTLDTIYNKINTRYNTDEEALRWALQIYKHSKKQGIDPVLFASLIKAESYGNPNAVSVAGALGLTQVIPGLWVGIYPECGPTYLNSPDGIGFKNPVTNICYGTSILNHYYWKSVIWVVASMIPGSIMVIPAFDVQYALNLYSGFSTQYAKKTSPYSHRIMEGTF